MDAHFSMADDLTDSEWSGVGGGFFAEKVVVGEEEEEEGEE